MCYPEPGWVYNPVLDVQGFKMLLYFVEARPFDARLPGNILEEFHLLLFEHHFSFRPGCLYHSLPILKVLKAQFKHFGDVAVLASLQAVGSFIEDGVRKSVSAQYLGKPFLQESRSFVSPCSLWQVNEVKIVTPAAVPLVLGLGGE